MAKLRVAIEGIAFWMDRGSHWEVLFPKARRSHLQHVPRMTVTVGKKIREGIPLVGQTLDLLHLSEDDCGNIDKNWMLSMPAGSDAPAYDDQVATSRRVISSVLLPRLALKAVRKKLTGPVKHGSATVDLDFGTVWECSLASSDASLIHRDRTTGAIADRVPLGNGAANVTVRIRNFTEAEHNGVAKPTKHGERLHDVQDLFALAGLKLPSPQYTGPTLTKPPAARSASAKVGLLTYPYKLCPQGDGG